MRVLLLIVVLMLSGCGYKCGDAANGIAHREGDVAGIAMTLPLVLIEVATCYENIEQ